ncbi:MAG: hypothetical protein AAF598_08760 [Bacteroidota bacterium]
MHIFQRNHTIQANMGVLSLESVMRFPVVDTVDEPSIYPLEIVSKNAVKLSIDGPNPYFQGIHDLAYDETKQEIQVFSRYEHPILLLYVYFVLIFLPLTPPNNTLAETVLIALSLFLMVFFTAYLAINIRMESRRVERLFVERVLSLPVPRFA